MGGLVLVYSLFWVFQISSISKIIDRSVSAEITILTNVSDNGAVYKCEASNPATEVPLIEAIKLNVLCKFDIILPHFQACTVLILTERNGVLVKEAFRILVGNTSATSGG